MALGAAEPAWARNDRVPGSRYTSGRAAGMGDAFLPLADDGAGGLFYNPAAIGRIRDTQFEPLNFQLQSNMGYIGNLALDFFKFPSLSGYAAALDRAPGVRQGGGFALLPNVYSRGFAFGMLMQSVLIADSDGTRIRYRSKYQMIPTVGTALRLADGVIRIGYSLQWVHQASGERSVTAGSSPLGWNEGLGQGSALSHNIGFAMTIPQEYLPAFNIVARNVLGAHFNGFSLFPLGRNTVGQPADEPMTIDASVSLQPKLGNGLFFNVVAEYRDATNRSGISALGRAALGLEFSARDQFFIRGGLGGGYPSLGVGLRRPQAEFSFAWYSEELSREFRGERDQRVILHYQIRAF